MNESNQVSQGYRGPVSTPVNSLAGSHGLGRVGTSVNEPKKESEFDRQGTSLQLATGELIGLIESLNHRLEGVMRPPTPEKEDQTVEPMTNTALTSFIREERAKIEGCNRRLRNILARLEL